MRIKWQKWASDCNDKQERHKPNGTAYNVTEMRIQRDKNEKWHRKLSTLKQYERPNFWVAQLSAFLYKVSCGNTSM